MLPLVIDFRAGDGEDILPFASLETEDFSFARSFTSAKSSDTDCTF